MPQRRHDWFYRQRAYPSGRIPSAARLKALEQRERMRRFESTRAAESRIAPSLTISPTMWTPIGPRPTNTPDPDQFVSGRVSAIAVDPTNPSIIYLGGAQGGVWKTTDGGSTWMPLTDDQPSLAVGSIAIDPTSCTASPCQTIFVGTGEQGPSGSNYYGAGLLKSTDAGATWSQLPGQITNVPGITSFVGPFSDTFFPGGGARIGSLAVQPTNGNVLLAAVWLFVSVDTGSSSGIYRSTDGGVTWTNVLPGAVGTEVFFDPTNANIAYAALGTPFGDPDNGVYRSTDGGVTWSRVDAQGSSKLPTNAGRIEIAIAPSSPGTLYASLGTQAVFGPNDNLLGFFRSTDSGKNWTQMLNTPDYCQLQCSYDHVVRVSPANPNLVIAGGSAINGTVFRSLDGGMSWDEISAGANGMFVHVDLQSLAFSPDGSRLLVGTDGGIWSTSNPEATGVNWDNLNATLQLAQFYPSPSIHPSSEHIAFGGTQDNGTQEFTGGIVWQDVGACGDGGWAAIDNAIPSTVYTACQNIRILKSVQNGELATFFLARSGIDLTDRVEFIPPLVIDPVMSQRLYFGTFRVYQSADGAARWTAVSPDLTGASSEDAISTIAVAPSESNIVYAGTSNGHVQRTDNAGAGAGATWTDLTTPDLPPRFITQIVVDPSTSATAYVTFSGFSGTGQFFSDTKGHVFKTTDGGIAWTEISGTGSGALPNIPVNDILIDPAAAPVGSTLYVASDVGVFATTDGGTTWAPLVAGLPNVAVLALKLHHPSRTLRAATHGRGMWDLQLGNLPAFVLSSLAPTSANAGAAGLSLAVEGNGFTSSSVIQWNGAPRTTNFVGANELTATISASDLAAAAAVPVTVSDPGQSSPSNALVFTVLAGVPSISSLSPGSVSQGSGAFTLVVDGANFVSSSVVRWNGSDRPTTFVSSGQLTAAIGADDVAAAGSVVVTVFTPPPGGGTSGAQSFSIGPAPDFAVSASPAALSVPRGQSATTTISVTPSGGFSGTVTFACSGLPRLSSCSFSPASVAPAGSPATTTLTIATSPDSATAPPSGLPSAPLPASGWAVASLLLLALVFRAARPMKPRFTSPAATLTLLALLLGLAACGGGNSATAPPPPVTFPVTVTAKSGTLQHSTTVALTLR